MNLHGLVRGAIGAVNPDIPACLHKATGEYETSDAGIRTPKYKISKGKIQVQGVNGRDLERLNNLNMQGIFRSVYLYGELSGIVRSSHKGGDLIEFADVGSKVINKWLVVQVAEVWPDWCKVIVCQQLN
jgi:hypothetical protein